MGRDDLLGGLLTGALVGASLAMIFAPVSGGEMRDILRAKAGAATVHPKDGSTPVPPQ